MTARYKIATVWWDPGQGPHGKCEIDFEERTDTSEDRAAAVVGLMWALRSVPEVRDWSHSRFMYAGALAEGVG